MKKDSKLSATRRASLTRLSAADVMDKNYNCQPGSFLWALHDRGMFDEALFWKYYDSVVTLAKQRRRNSRLATSLYLKVQRTFSNILQLLVCHFDPYDQYRIKNLPRRRLFLYIDRIATAVDGYFAGYVLEESKYDKDLRRPDTIRRVPAQPRAAADAASNGPRGRALTLGRFRSVFDL
jgi:hypothetical protein